MHKLPQLIFIILPFVCTNLSIATSPLSDSVSNLSAILYVEVVSVVWMSLK